ncbi:glycosyltransferase family 61 protein [Pontibacter sp. BT310]|uniref:Glycosyltransferase family 61 protein n=1 Tax=Pontibacter populi TaxID=890055 RepID=A0ABS6XDK9_9BACT|nr:MULTISPECIES: glycosyltransferase 61 family protein [Pontibacter]MBJ6119112.1 glycosyltransferase family 61 protein [Pontibacter sp. BT310]MBR0571540.1 glycosyltransferase family 61 protein [Microvirga sp. STS03]MBW3365966.1 glycosyltransferase family 61 protein [Pontibacter populi]
MGRIIPYNTRYRPSDVCRVKIEDANSQHPKEVKVHSIYPGLKTQLNIPEELYEAGSFYWKPAREVKTDYMVVEVPNGRIYTDNESSVAVVTQYNRLIENVSLSLVGGKVTEPNLNNIFEQRYFTAPHRFEGTVFSLLTGGAGLNNIGHWFIDVLPRLHLLRESGLYDKVDWFLVPSIRYDYQRETLELLGIPADKIIEGDKYTHITADCIIASTAPRGNHTLVPQWLCNFVQSSFLPYAEEEDELITPEAPSLYISRSDSSLRVVVNEDELMEALTPLNFQKIISSKLTIKEKVKLFSKANVVMGATGAGLISLFFCKPGTKVVEIFNEGFVVEPFYDIATKLDLDYNYIICPNKRKVYNFDQGQRANITVQIGKVVDLLQNLKKKAVQAKMKVA